MNKALLIVRCILEVILGGFMLLGVVAQIPQLNAPHLTPMAQNIARTLGQFTGMLLLGTLGYCVLRDGLRVGARIKSKPLPALPHKPLG